ncbi:MAG: hypothetical protein PF450_04925, partial [Bacteroidales bacterium]|nr:hypothetical protein [Bacteroidales bacterium]
MKRIIAFVMLTGLLFTLPSESFAQDSKKFMGEWTFNAPDATYGAQTGTITFTQKESEIKGVVMFPDGTKVDLTDIVMKGNELVFELIFEYEYIKVKLTLKDKK